MGLDLLAVLCCNHLAGEEKTGCFTFIDVMWLTTGFRPYLLHCAMGWSVSYTLNFADNFLYTDCNSHMSIVFESKFLILTHLAYRANGNQL